MEGSRYYAQGAKAASSIQHQHQLRQQHQPTSYEVWNNFFISAGIPSGVAHDYAITFSQHRIKIDMLKDITKDILLDMGIKAMGDIIAILRHAKQICTQNELKTTSGTSVNNPEYNPMVQQVKPQAKPQIKPPPPKPVAVPAPAPPPEKKIQSRLNLESGALVASSLSASMAKRLRNKIHETRPVKSRLGSLRSKDRISRGEHSKSTVFNRLGETIKYNVNHHK